MGLHVLTISVSFGTVWGYMSYSLNWIHVSIFSLHLSPSYQRTDIERREEVQRGKKKQGNVILKKWETFSFERCREQQRQVMTPGTAVSRLLMDDFDDLFLQMCSNHRLSERKTICHEPLVSYPDTLGLLAVFFHLLNKQQAAVCLCFDPSQNTFIYICIY